YINRTSKLLAVMDQILKKGFGSKTIDIDRYSRILAKYGFTIIREENEFKLAPVSSGLLQKEKEAVVSWIEQHANSKVLSHLKDARDNLGRGRFDYTLDDCRKAMEALTTSIVGFSDSLNELANEKIILQGSKDRKMDVELIKAIYGYCSTLGAHTSAKGNKPDFEQALLGLQNTESCIHFLLKRLETVKQSGKSLKNWA
ncbi:MAG: hypothetical protein QW279_02695, partial [Candidatus Jordarchaeaceae archaeon]